MFYVYGLVDPFTHQIRYIGQTGKTADERLNNHLREAATNPTCAKDYWVKRIVSLKSKPGVVVLQICASRDEALVAEAKWIKNAAALGWELENGTLSDYGPIKRAKLRIGIPGRPRAEFDENFVNMIKELVESGQDVSVNAIRMTYKRLYGKQCGHDRAKSLHEKLLTEKQP